MNLRVFIRLTLLFITILCLTDNANAQNNDYVWAKAMVGTNSSSGKSITKDASGNVYAVGVFSGTVDFDPGVGTSNLTSVGFDDVFITKLDHNGNLIWAKSVGGSSFEQGTGVAVDATGNVYVTGSFRGTVDFDPGATTANLTSAGLDDIFVLKLNSSGGYVWAKAMGGTSLDYGESIAVDASGNVYTIGKFEGTADFDPQPTYLFFWGYVNMTSAGYDDIFVSKLDASGNYVSVKTMGGTGSDWGTDIALDANNNIFITGTFNGTVDFDPGAGTANLSTISSMTGCFVSKLNADGTYDWAKPLSSATSTMSGNSLALDPAGNVYLTGYFGGTVDFDPGAGTDNLTSGGHTDIFILKLNAAGTHQWAKATVGSNTSYDEGFGIAVDAAKYVYTTGHFSGTVDFNPGAGVANLISADNDYGIFISKLDSTGTYVWAKSIGATGFDEGNGITVDESGNIYTTGTFTGTVDFDPGTGTANLTTGFSSSRNIFVSKLNFCFPTSSTETTTMRSSYTWNGTSYTSSGTYTWLGTNSTGCDSLATLHLTILPNMDAPTNVVGYAINSGAYLYFDEPANAAAAGGISTYIYSTNNGASWITPSPIVTASPLHIPSGLTNCTAYNIKIRAANGYGSSDASAAVSVTPTVSSLAGSTWTSRTPTENFAWSSIAYGNGKFIAVSNSATNKIMISTDGSNWTQGSFPIGVSSTSSGWGGSSISFCNGKFVIVLRMPVSDMNGVAVFLMTSTDGITWTQINTLTETNWKTVTYGQGIYVALAELNSGNQLATSNNAINWTERAVPFNLYTDWHSVTYGNGAFVAVGNSGAAFGCVMTSPDGITWTGRTASEALDWSSVTYGNRLFVAVAKSGTGTRIMTSANGVTWTSRSAPALYSWNSVTYENGLFVAVGASNKVMTSTDGINWTLHDASANLSWSAVTYGNGGFVAVATDGVGNGVMTSELQLAANAPQISSVTPSTSSASIAFTSSLPSVLGLISAPAITNIEYSTDNGSNWITPSPASTSSPLSIGSITTGTYQVQLRAVNSVGASCPSAASSLTIASLCSTTYGTDTQTACASYTWHGTTYTSSNTTATWTTTNAGGCDSIVTLHLTINALPAVPSAVNNSRTGAGTVVVSATPGTGETVDWYAAASGGTALSSGATSYTTPSISTTTVYYAEARNTTTGCVSATRTAVTATVNPAPNNWIGGSGNWNIAANWSASVVPDGSTNLTISAGTPTLDVDFTLSAGKTFTLSGTGSLVIAAGKTFTTAGTTDFGNRPVTLKSSASGTASIGPITGVLSNATQVTVERYLPSTGRMYRLLSPSVTTSGSLRDNWMEGGLNTTVGLNVNPNTGYGTQVTGSGGNSNGFDATGSNEASVYATANGTNLSYTALGGTSNPLNALTGYFLFVRGDRSINMTLPNTNIAPNPVPLPSSATILRATGTLVQGTQTSFTNPLLSTAGAYNLVTNPYASAIDWSLVHASSTNIENYYTLWDPNIGFRGGFVTVNTSGVKSVVASNATTTIQSGQAFFVTSTGGGTPQISIQESHKTTTGVTHAVFGTGNIQAVPSKLSVSLYYVTGGGTRKLADGVSSQYSSSYAAGLDGNDAREIPNWDENLAIRRNNTNLAIESRPTITTADTLSLIVSNLKKMSYELQVEGSQFANPLLQAKLVDRFTQTSTVVALEGTTTIPVVVTADPASSAANRFEIIFSTSGVLPFQFKAFDGKLNGNGILLQWQVASDGLVARYEIEKSSDGSNYYSIGSKLSMQNQLGSNSYEWSDLHPSSGTSFYRVRAVSVDGSIQYTSVQKISLATRNEAAVQVYPNPLRGSKLSVQMEGISSGKYKLDWYNSVGQLVKSSTIDYPGGFYLLNTEVPELNGSLKWKLSQGQKTWSGYLVKLPQ